MVNEYDRILGSVRFEILVKASDYLDRLTAMAKSAEKHPDEGPRSNRVDAHSPHSTPA